MAAALWVVRVAETPHYTSPTIRVAAYIARHADPSGVVGTDANGRPVAEPRSVAAAIGLGESTVFKSLTVLDRDGFIEWRKASTPERFQGITGRVRLLLDLDAAS